MKRGTTRQTMGKARGGAAVPIERITHSILILRGRRVLLDSDLAALYGVTTKRFNEQVRRNLERFPADFMFQITAAELNGLRSQIGEGLRISVDRAAVASDRGSHAYERSGPEQK